MCGVLVQMQGFWFGAVVDVLDVAGGIVGEGGRLMVL